MARPSEEGEMARPSEGGEMARPSEGGEMARRFLTDSAVLNEASRLMPCAQ